MSLFSENIYNLRKNQKITQARLAEIVGVSPQAVSKWECGTAYPDMDILPKLCDALNTSVDYLIGYVPTKPFNNFDVVYKNKQLSFDLQPSPYSYKVMETCPFLQFPKVLDVGCGEGKDAIFFAKNGYDVAAFDISFNGIARVRQAADYFHIPIKAFAADMYTYKPTEIYDIMLSYRSFHFIKKENREEIMKMYQEHTREGGIHAVEVFVRKPFIEAAPDEEIQVSLWQTGELASYYADWEILDMGEKIIDCMSSGVPHKHVIDYLVARKPTSKEMKGKA